MLDNKWRHGKVQFVLPPLPRAVLSVPGLKPWLFIVDRNIGSEIVLLINEPIEQLEVFRGREVTGFWLKSGLGNTSFGPVYWLLFYFPDPVTGERIVYENIINPFDPGQVDIYYRLGDQKYWHVVIADDTGVCVNFFEFPNNYGLSEALKQVRVACSGMSMSDFMRAKAEYQALYTIDRLLEM